MADPVLSDRHAAFVAAYLVSKNGTQAALEAGYTKASAPVMASKLLDGVSFPHVYKAVQIQLQRQEMRTVKKAEDILRYIHTAMFFEPMKFFSPGEDGGWLLSEDQYVNLPPEIGCLVEEVELQKVIVSKPDGSTATQVRYWVRIVSKTAMTKIAAQHQLLAKGAGAVDPEGAMPLPWDDLYTRRRLDNDPVERRIQDVKVLESKPLKAPDKPLQIK